MMKLSRMTILSAGLGLVCLAGCSSDLQKTNSLLVNENEDLRSQLGDRNSALAENEAQLREKDLELSRLRQNPEPYTQPPLAQVTGFEMIDDVSASYAAGEITVSVASDVLFSPGKTTLKTAAKQSLDQVASVVAQSYAEHFIRVEGYTDSDPIRKSGHRSNYHLGFERGYAVRDYLILRGVDADRISVSSYGASRPLPTKAESRRVEIVLYDE
jgi:outer membrane protein OmpA-like peptidoglycan-associated protein